MRSYSYESRSSDDIVTLPHRGTIPRSVVDGIPVPILLSKTSDDVVVGVNAAFTSAFGHTSADADGMHSRDLYFVPEDRASGLGDGGPPLPTEVRLKTASGACVWARSEFARFSLDGTEDVVLTFFHDVGAHRRAEALASEMALFPDMNPGLVVSLDLDGTIRRSNAAARAQLGEGIEGRSFWELCPAVADATRRKVLAGGPPVHEEVELEGAWHRLTIVHAPRSDRIFVFGTDITKERLARRELEERARFPAMNPGAVARLTADGTVIRANPAARALFGRESLVGSSWLELCPGIDPALWRRVLESETPVQVEVDIGELCVAFALRHEPIADQVFVYGSDVTALKKAEKALAELARFPDMNPGPVCRLDRQGRVILANPAARHVFDCEELTGRSWLELVPNLDRAFWEHVLQSDGASAVESKIGERHFVLTYAPGPEKEFVFVYGSDVTKEKEAERVLRQRERLATLGTLAAGVAHELNNPAAAAQRAATQLERSLTAMGEARLRMDSAGMVLDTGTLRGLESRAKNAAGCPCDLDPIARSDRESQIEEWLEGYDVDSPWDLAAALVEGGEDLAQLEQLASEIGPEHSGVVLTWHAHSLRVYRLLEEIRHGTGRLAEIVGAMKSYSYLGQAPIQNVDINQGIRNTLIIMRSKLKAGIKVEQDFAEHLPLVEAYGSELNQVWTNLIDNAADAMDGKGHLRLRTSAVDDRVIVEVEDDGPGIPADAQGRVFDAFFTTKEPGRGTGLGLNTSYSVVVQKHHGAIRLESVPGRTLFTVELPIRRPRPASEAAI